MKKKLIVSVKSTSETLESFKMMRVGKRMTTKRLFIACVLLVSSSCSTPEPQKRASMVMESIPLKIFSKGKDGIHASIGVLIEGKSKELLLDSGAPTSRIPLDDDTKKYLAVEKRESKGVSGKGSTYDVVKPASILIGSNKVENFKVARGGGEGILGLDLLSKTTFRVDIANGRLDFLNFLPPMKPAYKMKQLKRGHVTIPLTVGEELSYGLFDTGSDATIVDLEFLKKNESFFKLLRTEVGYDHNNNEVESEIYLCKSLSVGHMRLTDVRVAVFDFPPFLRSAMEGTPFIIGNNVIKEAKWSFDLEKKAWTSEE